MDKWQGNETENYADATDETASRGETTLCEVGIAVDVMPVFSQPSKSATLLGLLQRIDTVLVHLPKEDVEARSVAGARRVFVKLDNNSWIRSRRNKDHWYKLSEPAWICCSFDASSKDCTMSLIHQPVTLLKFQVLYDGLREHACRSCQPETVVRSWCQGAVICNVAEINGNWLRLRHLDTNGVSQRSTYIWCGRLKDSQSGQKRRLVGASVLEEFPPPVRSLSPDSAAEAGKSVMPDTLASCEEKEQVGNARSGEKARRKPAAYYGICDLKYDSRRPQGHRVKVLELGNAFASKFTGCGEHIPNAYLRNFRMANKLDRELLVNNKKFTHDVFVESGYSNFRPLQAFFTRRYTPELHRTIASKLGLQQNGDDTVVLKLVNRCRGAGVVVSRTGADLDQSLQKLLNLPELWTDKSPEVGLKKALSNDPASMDEHCKLWWSNECPIFVAETCEASQPLRKEGCATSEYDPTMRIGFVVLRNGQKEDHPFCLEFLGGYWKFPESPVSSGDVRARCVSKAKLWTSPVDDASLQQVYSDLRRVLADVFLVHMAKTSSYEKRYAGNWPFLSFLKMRQAISRFRKEQQDVTKKGDSATSKLPNLHTERLFDSPEHSFSEWTESTSSSAAASHVERQLGNRAAIRGDWEVAAQRWRRSLLVFGWNASSEHLLGLHSLNCGHPEEAEGHLLRSLAMDPEFKATYANLSATYLRLRRYEAAEHVAQEGLKRYPRTAECSYNLGLAIALRLRDELRRSTIHGHQPQFLMRARKAIRLLGDARDDIIEHAEEDGPRRSWVDDDDALLRNLEVLADHLESHSGTEAVHDFDVVRIYGQIVCNFRP